MPIKKFNYHITANDVARWVFLDDGGYLPSSSRICYHSWFFSSKLPSRALRHSIFASFLPLSVLLLEALVLLRFAVGACREHRAICRPSQSQYLSVSAPATAHKPDALFGSLVPNSSSFNPSILATTLAFSFRHALNRLFPTCFAGGTNFLQKGSG